MNKAFLIIAMVLAASHVEGKVRYELKAGLNYSAFSGMGHLQINKRLEKAGPQVTVAVEWLPLKYLGLQGAVSYSVLSGNVKDEPIWPVDPIVQPHLFTYDVRCEVGYVQVGVLLGLHLPLGKDVFLRFHGGPSVSVALKDYSSYTRRRYLRDVTPLPHSAPDVHLGFNMEPALGPGDLGFKDSRVAAAITWKGLVLELGYYRFALPVGAVDSIQGISAKLHAYSITLGYSF